MNAWLAPQIDYLLFLQNFREITGGAFDNLFMFITSLGEITFPVMILAGIYWCINSKDGIYILWNWCLGMFFCQFLKSLTCIYRPWVLDSRITPIPHALSMSGGYSFPSGHTQTAVAIWGGIAVCYKNKILRTILILLILLIAFSRNYIGVHTPQDVIVSVALSVILLFVVKKILEWVEKGKNNDIIVLVSVLLGCLLLVLFEHFKSYPMDYLNGELLVNPLKMQVYTFPKMGLIMGTFIGWFVCRRFIGFDGAIGTVKEKVVRYLVGSIVLSVVVYFVKVVFSDIVEQRFSMFITSFLSSLFITAIYPAIVVAYRKKYCK